jgi:hypothetical protein
MNLILNRVDANENGIFSYLQDSAANILFYTLEHSYAQPDGSYAPKLPNGNYTCVKGLHSLDHTPTPFEAFEVTNVPGHSGILFHVGNYNSDSDGCILLGTAIAGRDASITNSKLAFEKFMTLQADNNQFTLTVI